MFLKFGLKILGETEGGDDQALPQAQKRPEQLLYPKSNITVKTVLFKRQNRSFNSVYLSLC